MSTDNLDEMIEGLHCHRSCSWNTKCGKCQAADAVKAEIERLRARVTELENGLS